MGRKLLRGLGLLAYAALLVLAFGFAAYLSFSTFVRSGVIPVPDVVGLSRADAGNRLVERGLALQVAAKGRYDDKVPAGKVLRQIPDARTFVKRGSRVQLVLSSGPQRVEVPDLVAQTFPVAQVTLSGRSLIVGTTLSAFVAGHETGTVVAQDPDPGAEVPPASQVDVLLAQPAAGERFIMPDLVYHQYERVRTFFEREKFRLGSVKYERYEGVAAGVILRQFPLPGHPLSHDDPVSLVVATTEDVPG
ncbi:MAG TPA: PASTA domain-containing protein [Thermoanaerobaculia bacterium]|nr:PASTA domain-containing protein [Thermoanaerobaculia bacterium]